MRVVIEVVVATDTAETRGRHSGITPFAYDSILMF